MLASNTLAPTNPYYASDCGGGGDWYGVRVISSKRDDWVDSREVWNQHAYSISNINDDLSVPSVPLENWDVWNNFRTADNSVSPVKFRPDLVPRPPQVCTDICVDEDTVLVYLGVGNQSSQDVVDPFTVGIYSPSGLLRQQSLAGLPSGTSEIVGPFYISRAEWSGALEYRVDNTVITLSDGTMRSQIIECDEDNTLAMGDWPCD